MTHSAVISDCGRYRYRLERIIGPHGPVLVVIMLNPSTADALVNDATIRWLIGFCRRNGYAKLVVVNLFGIRATDPKDMRAAADPVGPDNHEHVMRALMLGKHLGDVLCAWGVHGRYMDQDLTMLGWLAQVGVKPKALVLTKAGDPSHPLYKPADIKLIDFQGRAA